MTTLIERLRKAIPAELPREAADEIERLQRENEALRKNRDEFYATFHKYYSGSINELVEEWQALKSQASEPVSGEISDGYHTFNELYAHRHALFIKLMRSHPDISWRANNHEDGTMFEGGLFIAGMHLPNGDISYHIPIDYWELLDHSGIATSNCGPKWDGHTAEDVVTRLNNWWATPPQAEALVADFKRRAVEAVMSFGFGSGEIVSRVSAASAIESLPLIEGEQRGASD